MGKRLERDLGLFEVVTISIGAMIGSGIFILPALAVKEAGAAVILAYLLAGLLVLPAALSKSEMASALPEAGGTYLFIERAMGPFLGTIAGVGTWFSLTFKSALALVGGVPYLVLLFDLPVTPVAVTLAVLLIILNTLGTKHTGRLQNWIVTAMLAALAWFIYGSRNAIETANYAGFMDSGIGGLFAATGLVFVSYAGVTKIASVAEEIKNPGRNIPLGMIGSLAFTTLLYVLLVGVMIGVASPGAIEGSLTPMADAAEAALGYSGVLAVIAAAIMALVSTANAGLLSASRFPLAMARDALFPDRLGRVSERFSTPVNAITLTGAVMLVLILFVPIMEIAKLASAFQILVFALINVAVIALREGDITGYSPTFRSPMYPWIQVAGCVLSLALLTQMGAVAIIGSVSIILCSSLWYHFWARDRVNREGAATQAFRQSLSERVMEETREQMQGRSEYRVLVALTEGTPMEEERDMLSVATTLATPHDGTVSVMQFDQVPGQVPLGYAVEQQSEQDREFEEQIEAIKEETGVEATVGEVAAHDVKQAIVSYAEHHGIDIILMPRASTKDRRRLRGSIDEWVMRHAPCTVLLVEDRGIADVDEIAVVTNRGAYEPSKIEVANALAEQMGAYIRLVFPLRSKLPQTKEKAIESYHDELASLCTVPVEGSIIQSDDRYGGVAEALEGADLVIVSINGGKMRNVLFGRPEAEVIDNIDATSIEFHAHQNKRLGVLERFIERLVF